MAITQTLCTSFKSEILQGTHALLTDTLKIALYSSTATLNADTTVYTTTGEISGTGYSAGGTTISGVSIATASGVAYLTFNNVSWVTSTITARGALIYNSSKSNKTIAVLDFGSDKISQASTFLITLPAAAYTTAIIRI